MLEEFDDLISTLCANSPIMRKERDGRLFFTNDGLIFDSFWESNDYFKFDRSERPSFGGGYLWTRNPTIAQYQLLRTPGHSHRYRARLRLNAFTLTIRNLVSGLSPKTNGFDSRVFSLCPSRTRFGSTRRNDPTQRTLDRFPTP